MQDIYACHDYLRKFGDVLPLTTKVPTVIGLALEGGEEIYWVENGYACLRMDAGKFSGILITIWLVPQFGCAKTEEELGGELF